MTEDLSDIFGFDILAKSDYFGSMKNVGNILARRKKTERFFGVAKKGQKDFLGYTKKSNKFFG